MYLGVDYYPEQWPKEMMDDDLKDIAALGCNIIRIGDFAWDVMEKEEGKYDFSFFDEVVAKAAAHGLKTMMCIPSATMPRWLHKKYPSVMAEDELGHKQPYGGRRGYCYNSEIYRRKAVELSEALAKHFAFNKNIVAYQLDNEIGHEGSDMCYCENCRREFIEFLKRKYACVEMLNERWGTSFWTQHYDSFDDIVLPKRAYTVANPSLQMEWERFRSFSIERFLSDMAQVFRKYNDGLVIHDWEGGTLEKHFDPFEVSKTLDEIAYNNYPIWGGRAKAMENYETAFALDCARGFKQSSFWITEEIMGAQGHNIIGGAIKPKQGSLWAIQALSHGCKSFLIFRYRGFNKGAEQYCYGIVDNDNIKRRKYREVQQLYHYIRENEVAFSAPIKAQAAVVYDYDSASAFRIQPQSNTFDYVQQMVRLYRSFYRRSIATDIITKEQPLDGYKWVVVPYMIMMDRKFKEKLKAYVRSGGICLLTARSAWKDEDNNLPLNESLPYGLNDLCGCITEEYESLLDDETRELSMGEGHVFADYLRPTTGKPLADYKDCPYGPYSALVQNHYGNGICYSMATVMDESLQEALFERMTGITACENEYLETVQRGEYRIEMNFNDFSYDISMSDKPTQETLA